MLILETSSVGIAIRLNKEHYYDELIRFLETSFPKRYIPSYSTVKGSGRYSALIDWEINNGSFEVKKVDLTGSIDWYSIKSPLPVVYVNESPVFFILQVLARTLIKKNYFLLTDSVVISTSRKNALLLGYPHSGKSTLSTIAISRGDLPLSTENTVVKVGGDCLRVINGTSILVYDPKVEEIYGIKVPWDEETKHGYRAVDLDKVFPIRRELLRNEPCIDEIYLIHCSFNSLDVSFEKIKGRKIKKTIWYFASAILSGVDYYEPYPLNMVDKEIYVKLVNFVEKVAELYGDKMIEVFGRHDKTYSRLIKET